MMKRSLPAKWAPAQAVLHFSLGPADTGGKTESTDDEGSGGSDSDDGDSDSDDSDSDSDDGDSD